MLYNSLRTHWAKLCYFLLFNTCLALPYGGFEVSSNSKIPLGSLSLLALPLFNNLYTHTVKQVRFQGDSDLISQPDMNTPPSLLALKALLIPDSLPDWHLQHLNQHWHQINLPPVYPEIIADTKYRIYLSLINQRFRIAIQQPDAPSIETQTVLIDKILNTLHSFYQILLDRFEISEISESTVLSAAAGGDGGDDGDDDPHYSLDWKKPDFFVYQSDTGWKPLSKRLIRQQSLRQSLQKKRRLLSTIQWRIQQAISHGHEQLARILQDRVMLIEVEYDELKYQLQNQNLPYVHNNVHNYEAQITPLLQSLLKEIDVSGKKQDNTDTQFHPVPKDGGGEQSDKKTASQPSSSQKGQGSKRSRDEGDKSEPPDKKPKEQVNDYNSGSGNEKEDPDKAYSLSDEQLQSLITRQMLLDIAWELRGNLKQLQKICAVPIHTSRTVRLSSYVESYMYLKECIDTHKIESIEQLLKRFASNKELADKIITAFINFSDEPTQTEGKYSDFYAYLTDTRADCTNCAPRSPSIYVDPYSYTHPPSLCIHQLSLSLEIGLHLGEIKFEELLKRICKVVHNSSIFTLYNEKHPNEPLSWILPRLKKALHRIDKEYFYDTVFTEFTAYLSEQKNSQQQPLKPEDTQNTGREVISERDSGQKNRGVKRPRDTNDNSAPLSKKPRLSLNDQQLKAHLSRQMLLDIAWRFRGKLAPLRQMGIKLKKVKHPSSYIESYMYIDQYVSTHQIETVEQLLEHFPIKNEELLEKIIEAIINFSNTLPAPTSGEYHDLYSYILLNPSCVQELLQSLEIGLHIGQVSFDKMRLLTNKQCGEGNIFKLYNEEHPRKPLVWIFPQLKKALTRMDKHEVYDHIVTGFNTYASEQNSRKLQAAEKDIKRESAPKSEDSVFEITGDVELVTGNGESLPIELWIKIFCFLDLDDLHKVREVCKFFSIMSNHSDIIKKHQDFAPHVSEGYQINDYNLRWLRSIDWRSPLIARKTHREIIRQCKRNPDFLASYLWKNNCFEKLYTLAPDHLRRERVNHIASDYDPHTTKPPRLFSVVVMYDSGIARFTSDYTHPQKTHELKEKPKKKTKHMSSKKTFQSGEAVISEHFSNLFVTFSDNNLCIWDASTQALESRQQVISNIDCMTIMKKGTSFIIVTATTQKGRNNNYFLYFNEVQEKSGYHTILLTKIKINRQMKQLRTMKEQTKLVALDKESLLSLWEFNTEGVLCQKVGPHAPREVPPSNLHFPLIRFGNTIYGTAYGKDQNDERYFVIWDSELNVQSCLLASAPLKAHPRTRIIFFIDDTLFMTDNQSITLLRYKRENEWEELRSFAIEAPLSTVTVVNKNFLLIGKEDGEVSLYFLPLPLLP